MIPGVDVSNWQGEPSQWQAAAGDYQWAAVKFTELLPDGTRYLNPDAAADWAALKRDGKGRVAFLFAHPASSPAETIAYFVSSARAAGFGDRDMVMVDLEQTDGRNPAQVSVWARIVLRGLQNALRRVPLLYTFLDFAASGNCTGLDPWPLWISEPSAPAGDPQVPAPWTAWAIHQTTITGAIDRDLANYPDLQSMTRELGHTAAAPDPHYQEEPMLLKTGASAVTPVALPSACSKLRFFSAEDSTASLTWQLEGDAANAITVDWSTGSKVIDIPPGKNGVKITRIDAGTGDVSVALEF